jgi:hypothetical protein
VSDKGNWRLALKEAAEALMPWRKELAGPILTNAVAYDYQNGPGRGLGCWAEATLLNRSDKEGATYQRLAVFTPGRIIAQQEKAALSTSSLFTLRHNWSQ